MKKTILPFVIRSVLVVSLLSLAACSTRNGPEVSAPDATTVSASATLPPSTDTPEPTPTPTPAPTSTPDAEASRQAIANALQATTSNAYRASITIDLDQGGRQEVDVTFAPPDRYHIFANPVELLVSGAQVYMKQGNGWLLTGFDAGQIIAMGPQGIQTFDVQNARYTGQETLDGREYSVYTYDSAVQTDSVQNESSSKIWIGVDGKPYRIDSVGDVIGMNATTGTAASVKAESSMVYEFDPSIEVDDPNAGQ
jgi:hypothetical protein